MLSVAMLVIVMSVMNGFRAELIDKIVGLNGHAIIQAYGGRLENWQQVLEEVRETPGVVRASPLIEQPLLVDLQRPGRGGAGARQHARGHPPLAPNVLVGDLVEPAARARTTSRSARGWR